MTKIITVLFNLTISFGILNLGNTLKESFNPNILYLIWALVEFLLGLEWVADIRVLQISSRFIEDVLWYLTEKWNWIGFFILTPITFWIFGWNGLYFAIFGITHFLGKRRLTVKGDRLGS